MTEQTKAGKAGPAVDLRFFLISALAIVCSFAAFPWHEGAALVILSCCAAALLVWAATSRENIDNVWWPAVGAVGRTLGPVFGGAFALAAAGLGVTLLFAVPYIVIAVALVWLVWHVMRR
jgi:hypothetical protein